MIEGCQYISNSQMDFQSFLFETLFVNFMDNEGIYSVDEGTQETLKKTTVRESSDSLASWPIRKSIASHLP